MLRRISVAIVCVPLIFVLVYIAPPMALSVAVALLSVFSVYEALWSTAFLKNKRIIIYSSLFAVFFSLESYFGIQLIHVFFVIFIYTVLLFAEIIYSRNTLHFEQAGGAFFLTLFISVALSSLVRLRLTDHWRFLTLLPFVIAFLSDAFALFTGMACGKHPLAPTLSPHKTVEGAVGGLIGATLSGLAYAFIYGRIYEDAVISVPTLIFCSAFGAVLSQMGDLSFSCIKREFNLKDFGKILPGHGGILDRFDSVIFCAPFVELLSALVIR